MTICKSGEYHRIDVLVIGCAFPNLPAGMVVTVCVPSRAERRSGNRLGPERGLHLVRISRTIVGPAL